MRSSRPEVDDLLQPTLADEADPARMRAAWNPWQLAVLAVLGGPLTAGYLYGDNFRRLGRKALFGWCMLGALVLLGLAGLLGLQLRGHGFADFGTDGTRLARTSARLVTVPAIVPIAYLQQRRYRAFLGHGGESGGLWKVGLAAVLLGGFVGNLLVYQLLRWTWTN